MTCFPLRYTSTSTKDTFDFIDRNFSSGKSDEFFVWWRKFARRIVSPDENFTRQSFARLGIIDLATYYGIQLHISILKIPNISIKTCKENEINDIIKGIFV